MDLLELTKFKAAEMGICSTWHGDHLVERLIYDGVEIIKVLVEEENMTEDEAAEYIEREFVFKYAGDTQPIILWRVYEDDEDS